MSINPTGLSNLQNYQATDATSGKKELGQSDFLRLMIAQVQHQDPTEPNVNGDFIAQLAQFSANDGITKMQHSIQDLAASFQSNQALQASSLVGRKVMVNSPNFTFDGTNKAKIMANVPAPVTDVYAEIYSETGSLINRVPLGQKDMGQFSYEWNGMNSKNELAPAGKYKVQLTAMYQGQQVALPTMTTANVTSVTLGQNGDGIKLAVQGVGNIRLDQVVQITD